MIILSMIHIWSFSQSWLPKPEVDFRPGTARVSCHEGVLKLEAELIDEEVITTATNHQQRLWEHGDVVELFVQSIGTSDYFEYQIAPNGLTLSLHYPDISYVSAIRGGYLQMEEFLTSSPLEAKAMKTNEGWSCLLTVPIPVQPTGRIGVSCCRYDAASGRPPVISSTSPHLVRDFHRPQEWREITVVKNPD